MTVGLEIVRWAFWSPEAAVPGDWLSHWRKPGACSAERDVPGDGIPPAHRRRMSALSKMAIQAGLSACGHESPDFLVFCSQHGELVRTRELLANIAKGVELSPTAFSQSVHNSSAGLFSIITRSHVPATSLASGASTFAYGWLEAEAYIAEHREASVLLVACEEPLPAEYRPYTRCTQCSYAVALKLRVAAEAGVTLDRTSVDADDPLPMAPSFMAWWLSGAPSWRVASDSEGWLWERSIHGA